MVNIKLKKAEELLLEASKDKGIPRNVKNSIEECIKILHESKESEKVKLSTIISILDEISGDPNIPLYGRTKIWNLVSKLEEINI